MAQFVRTLFYVSLLFGFCQCTSLSIKAPGATIESPEVAGHKKKELGPSLEPALEIEYTDSVITRPPDLDNARKLGGTHTLLHQARFGLGERFELGGQLGIDTSSEIQTTYMVVGKFQLLGKPKAKAKAGDFSLGFHGRFAYVDANSDGDQQQVFGPGGFPWSAKVKAYLLMGGASLGYRVTDIFLVYGGASYQLMRSTINVEQDPASDNSDPGGVYTRDRDGVAIAAGLGAQIRIGKVFYLNGKLMFHEFDVDGVSKEEGVYAGGGFHFHF